MTFSIENNTAYISGANGSYTRGNAGYNYGKNAAENYKSYIEALSVQSEPLDKDVFTKGHTLEDFEAEVSKLVDNEMPPLNFIVQFAKSLENMGKKASDYIQGLLGFTYESSNGETFESVESRDLELQETYGSKNLSMKAFDVNKDGMIDITEEAVSTVLADYLSKESDDNITFSSDYMYHLDGRFTNKGENKTIAFLNTKNYDTASKIIEQIHTDLGLDEIQKEIL